MLSPTGRMVMISGASRGLGNAIARRLHADGYNVNTGARDATAFAELTVACRLEAHF